MINSKLNPPRGLGNVTVNPAAAFKKNVRPESESVNVLASVSTDGFTKKLPIFI